MQPIGNVSSAPNQTSERQYLPRHFPLISQLQVSRGTLVLLRVSRPRVRAETDVSLKQPIAQGCMTSNA